MSDFKFGQLSDEEVESLNKFANAHPQRIIQACIWMDLNVVMHEDMRKHLSLKCKALSQLSESEARIMEAERSDEL